MIAHLRPLRRGAEPCLPSRGNEVRRNKSSTSFDFRRAPTTHPPSLWDFSCTYKTCGCAPPVQPCIAAGDATTENGTAARAVARGASTTSKSPHIHLILCSLYTPG